MNTDTGDGGAATDTREQAAAKKAAELALKGYVRVDCGHCKGKGVRILPKNPERGEVACRICDNTGRVWVNVNRLKGKPYLPGQSIRKLKVASVRI